MNSHKSLSQRLRDFTWRGPAGPRLALASAIIVVGLILLIGAALLGFNRGLAERNQQILVDAQEHYDKGVAHLDAGRAGLAEAEFEMVLRLDPANAEAQAQLQVLRQQQTALPTPAPLPTGLPTAPAPPMPTVDLELLTLDAMLDQAQAAVQSGAWLTATALLNELSALAPDHRPDDVAALRFETIYQQGLALVEAERFEEALRAFDQALALQPDAINAQEQRELAALYANARGAWGADWAEVVDNLTAVVERRPDYLDAAERLGSAQLTWADLLADDGRWCLAAERYADALVWQPASETGDKQAEAAAFCANPPATPTAAVADAADSEGEAEQPGSGTVSAPAAGPGRLVFATFSDEFQRWITYQASSGDAQATPIIDDMSQPALALDGSQLAGRSERGDQTGLALFDSDGSNRQRLTTFAEDSHPSWSPDARQIVFDSNREGDRRWRIYLAWAGGGDATSLGFGQWPAWSPQGDSIAYQGCDSSGNRCGLWLIGSGGANQRPLTDQPGDTMPAWSPDGSQIAFASPERSGDWDIYLVPAGGGAVISLVSGAGVDAHPTWSPDGSQIAFLSNRSGAWAIDVADVASGQVSPALVLPGETPDWYEVQIDWGP